MCASDRLLAASGQPYAGANLGFQARGGRLARRRSECLSSSLAGSVARQRRGREAGREPPGLRNRGRATRGIYRYLRIR